MKIIMREVEQRVTFSPPLKELNEVSKQCQMILSASDKNILNFQVHII